MSTTPNPSSPQVVPALPESPGDRQRAFALESKRRKQRSDAFFHRLTSQQQDQLCAWVSQTSSVGELQKRVAAPPPDGFGLDIHYMTLQRFRSWLNSLNFVARRQEILDTVHDMEERADFSQSARIREAINQELHDHAFELARSNPGSDAFNRILTSIEKLSALDYKHRKLILEHQRPPRHPAVSSTHHRVELSIVPAPGAAPEKIITLHPESSSPPALNPPLTPPAPPLNDPAGNTSNHNRS